MGNEEVQGRLVQVTATVKASKLNIKVKLNSKIKINK